ncbi:hypothetical protein [Desulfoluna spongiiphila]|uniref:hypothetical protein n=1 Tax=Desulfoluna spongiiphila TaxID=419481 RepID=UPI001255945A|nr:hypothetical protein [Desulfoluna spongiiphila]VVS92743.1 hypothetical protein DBB_23110 [Desulfoluna spongiiphila]
MRQQAETWIREAAVQCGLSADSVMAKPEKPSLLDPKKRIELEYLAETFMYAPRPLAKWTLPEGTHQRMRNRVYTGRLPVRVEVISDDESWLDAFVNAFIVTMPPKRADADNNLVQIRVEKATREGFTGNRTEVFVRRSNSLHLTFEWMLCKETDLPLIRKVQFTPKTKEA